MNDTRFRATSLATIGLALWSSAFAVAASAQEANDNSSDLEQGELLDIPLEDLLTLESTSVAKKRQRVSEASSAVYVITQEDIQRSAASTIPDLLRGVPGVEVARMTNGGYAVTIRGFNSRLANSLLVMIDGRSQFVSTLSGVFWDQLVLPLGDIERIEIVRGPGSSLWGSNSSNGVINIITKHSADTGGTSVDVRAGSRFQQASVSYGGRVSDALSYRVYGKMRHDNGMVDATGTDTGNRSNGHSVGARLDWEPDAHNAATLQVDYAEGASDVPLTMVSTDLLNPGYFAVQSQDKFEAVSILGRWTGESSDKFDWSVQGQYNHIRRIELNGADVDWHLADIDAGFHWKPGETHDINFGIAARLLRDRVDGTPSVSLFDPAETDRWISAYVQDDISLIADTLRVTLGAKLEDNNFTGFEVQPTARIFFRPADGISFWGAVTRAVRTPSRMERAAQFSFTFEEPLSPFNPTTLPLYPILLGQPERKSEHLTAFEAGARFDLGDHWSLDLAGYYNEYHDLTVTNPTTVFPLFQAPLPFPVALQLDVELAGLGQAQTWGLESSLSGQVTPWWKLGLTYSYFGHDCATDRATGAPYQYLFPLDGSPKHQATLSNAIDIGQSLSIDSQLRHVSRLKQGPIPAYTALDLRLTYRLRNGAELSLVGTDLLKARHAEFTQPQYPTAIQYVPRTITGQLRYRF